MTKTVWKDYLSDSVRLVIPDNILLHLESWISSAGGREVSGVGTIEGDEENGVFKLNKVWLLAAGSSAFTEIPAKTMAKILEEGVDPSKIKVWWHRHPVGNGIPGSHNWSGTDQNTIRREPFGIDPSMVGWLISTVRTPQGWVARYDNHVKKQTVHMPVETSVNGKHHNIVFKMVTKHDAELRRIVLLQKSQPAQVIVPARQKPGFWDKLRKRFPKPVQNEWHDYDPDEDLDRAVEVNRRLGDWHRNLESMGWDGALYQEAKDGLMIELPEFVAYQLNVTPKHFVPLGLIDWDEYEDMCERIQVGVDEDDPMYLAMIELWGLGDL